MRNLFENTTSDDENLSLVSSEHHVKVEVKCNMPPLEPLCIIHAKTCTHCGSNEDTCNTKTIIVCTQNNIIIKYPSLNLVGYRKLLNLYDFRVYIIIY